MDPHIKRGRTLNFKIYVAEDSLKDLGHDINTLSQEINEKAKVQLQILASQVYGFIIQQANTDLKSTRDLFIQNLVGPIEAGDNIWVVGLKKEAEWIEEGYAAYDMLPGLLKGPKAKVNAKGQKYTVIPFKHNKPQSQSSRAQVQLSNYVKNELKQRGLDKILKGPDGKPLTGKVASLNITGPGTPQSRHGTPLLSGLTIYQTLMKNKSGKETVRRDVMTFRTASESQRGTGKWYNNGYDGGHIFNKVQGQVDAAWDKMIQELLRE